MTTKQLLHLGLSLSLLSSPLLLTVVPVEAQETNQSAATNVNATGSEVAPSVTNQSAATNPSATGSEVAPVFVPLSGGGTVPTFSTSGVQALVNIAAAIVNQQLTAGNLVIADLPANITPSSALDQQIVSAVLTGTNDGASLVSLLSTVAAQGTPISGVPPSGLVEALVNALAGLTQNGEVDAGKLAEAVDAYNAAIGGVTDAAYLRNPPGSLLTIRAALGQLIAASGTSPDAQPGVEGN